MKKRQLSDSLKIKGTILLYQTENGKVVPDPKGRLSVEVENSIANDFYIKLFREIFNGTGDIALDDLFTGLYDDKDGIVVVNDALVYTRLVTSYNAGGDGVDDTYIEYYGESEEALGTDDTYLQIKIGRGFNTASKTFAAEFASQSISYTVLAGRRLHVYYKLSKP